MLEEPRSVQPIPMGGRMLEAYIWIPPYSAWDVFCPLLVLLCITSFLINYSHDTSMSPSSEAGHGTLKKGVKGTETERNHNVEFHGALCGRIRLIFSSWSNSPSTTGTTYRLNAEYSDSLWERINYKDPENIRQSQRNWGRREKEEGKLSVTTKLTFKPL